MCMFLVGEKVILDTPKEADFEIWADWFNDSGVTRYLHYGHFPNSIYQQKRFYEKSLDQGNIILMIRSKDLEVLKGTISLSKIDFRLRSADLALVSPVRLPDAPLASLEAIALMVAHAFENLGLEKVYADQNFPGLIGWTAKMQMLGFQVEGFKRKAFLKNGVFEDSVTISITKDDYSKVRDFRNGNIWQGELQVIELLQKQKDSVKSSIMEAYQAQSRRERALLATLLHDEGIGK